MSSRSQLVCLWSGYAFFPLYLIGIVVIAGFIPPPSPNLSGEQIRALFEQHQLRIMVGMALCVMSSALYVPWTIALCGLMVRIDSTFPAYSLIQLISGALGAAFFMISPLVWATMAFRSGHGADLMQVLNDFAWISWIISWPFFLVQQFAVGLCALQAAKDQILIPRWVAFFSIWGAVTMVPAILIIFMKQGPFSWTGLFGLYLPLLIYSVWYHVMSLKMLKALSPRRGQCSNQLEAEKRGRNAGRI